MSLGTSRFLEGVQQRFITNIVWNWVLDLFYFSINLNESHYTQVKKQNETPSDGR